ncbi:MULTISPECIES: hypothetical protein [unclassified Variovorax]|uniref:hypothetical protein n=1 Tax=unclassified Variovorax TaxID=663243 RepID=UPI00076D293F|nr:MULTISPECIES: hypothetical protein [unclassified Variovorax]KWT96883.1 Inner membrane protein CreD [Variovorax sp. WDL1]PNG58731.1 hypothetical protein CHC07_00456 [Variovorax sp. B4]PNG61479.1 hypothetical protein CHC06_01380 [Variovorax sp. B2]VTV12502.1 hypothetical protein WDL1CHR_03285 [Variovorax sp. WDL1]
MLARLRHSVLIKVLGLLVLPQRGAQGRGVGQEARSKEMAHLVFPDKLHIEGSLAPQEREGLRGGRDGRPAGAGAAMQSFDVSLAQPLNVYAMSTP